MGPSWWPYILTLLSVVMFSMGTLMVRKASHIPALTKGVGCLVSGGVVGIAIALVLEPFPTGATTTGIMAMGTMLCGVVVLWDFFFLLFFFFFFFFFFGLVLSERRRRATPGVAPAE